MSQVNNIKTKGVPEKFIGRSIESLSTLAGRPVFVLSENDILPSPGGGENVPILLIDSSFTAIQNDIKYLNQSGYTFAFKAIEKGAVFENISQNAGGLQCDASVFLRSVSKFVNKILIAAIKHIASGKRTTGFGKSFIGWGGAETVYDPKLKKHIVDAAKEFYKKYALPKRVVRELLILTRFLSKFCKSHDHHMNHATFMADGSAVVFDATIDLNHLNSLNKESLVQMLSQLNVFGIAINYLNIDQIEVTYFAPLSESFLADTDHLMQIMLIFSEPEVKEIAQEGVA